MGNLISGYIQATLDTMASYWKTPRRILLLGLDGAGKTTLLYRLKLGEVITTIPTIGFNVESFQYKNIEFTAWDVGGQSKLRPLWKYYLQNTDAVIFVVDAADYNRLDEAAKELHQLFQAEELAHAKLLVYSNKQDNPSCATMKEVESILQLQSVTRNPIHIQPSIAVSGEGVYEGLDWLSKVVTSTK